MWYRADETLSRSPRVLRLSRLLKISRREALGLVHDLYSWAIKYADENGVLRFVEIDDIAAALEGGKGTSFPDALLDSGFLIRSDDGSLSVAGWFNIAGSALMTREKDRQRKRT